MALAMGTGLIPCGLAWGGIEDELTAIFVAAPFFGHLSVPRRARIVLALVIAWILAPESAGVHVLGQSGSQIAQWVIAEAAIGLSIGFLAQHPRTWRAF